MNEDIYNALLTKLNTVLENNSPSVSPINVSGGGRNASPEPLLITDNIEIEQLSNSQLIYTHTMLHKLYATGSKYINKPDIVGLHDRIKLRINHSSFDKLDKE